MKVFTSLYLICALALFAFFGCDEVKLLRPVDMTSEQAGDSILQWEYRPELNITLDTDYNSLPRKFAIHDDLIYFSNIYATKVYIFDMDGKLTNTFSRDVILGGRASIFAPHFGTHTVDGKPKYEGAAIADFIRSVKISNGQLIAEVGWWEGFENSWAEVRSFAGSTTVYWDLDTGNYWFGDTKRPCWDDSDKWCIRKNNTIRGEVETTNAFLDDLSVLPIDGFNPDALVHDMDETYSRFRRGHGVIYGDVVYVVPISGHTDDALFSILPNTLYAFQKN